MDSLDSITSLEKAIDLVRWNPSGPLKELNSDMAADYQRIFPHGTWFRGQEDSSWRLIPSIFRKNESGVAAYARVEPRIVQEFKLANTRLRAKMADNLDWLAVMQHHGVPTRILDWTENPLIALFFAVRQIGKSDEKPGALFVLNSFKLNSYTSGRPDTTILYAGDLPSWVRAELSENPSFKALRFVIRNVRPGDLAEARRWIGSEGPKCREHFSRPVAVWPRKVHQRMLLQQSMFVVHGGSYADIAIGMSEPVLLDELQITVGGVLQFLCKFEIPANKKEQIRHELRAIGFHVGSLFPELEYQSEHIKSAWIPTGPAFTRKSSPD